MQKGHLHLVCFSNRISQSYTLYSKLILSYYSTLVMKKQWVHRNIIHIICVCLVAQSCPTLSNPIDCNPPGSSVHGILQARILEWVAIPFSRGSSQPRTELRSPADSLPAEPQGKPKDTGMGSLSLLQQIFLTQELNWGLLHCRRILGRWFLTSLLKSLGLSFLRCKNKEITFGK